jgi:hypothetical protein
MGLGDVEVALVSELAYAYTATPDSTVARISNAETIRILVFLSSLVTSLAVFLSNHFIID